jgi:2-polyprenyl-3-methyl-5-hydroxy-6-metoxy-1,4-benzoquinol methylase
MKVFSKRRRSGYDHDGSGPSQGRFTDTVSNHFATQEELIESVVGRILADIHVSGDTILIRVRSLTGRLQVLTTEMYAFFARTSHWFELWYRFGTPPWVGQARSELVELVESGELLPGMAIDLGCGEGDNAILLAQHGFQVTVVDFSPAGIAKAKASKASAEVEF